MGKFKKDKIEKFKEAVERLKKCDGHKINSFNRDLDLSFRIFAINYSCLEIFIANLKVRYYKEQEEKEKDLVEILRLLINFLMSGQAFVGHFRKSLIDQYEESIFFEEYSQKVKENFSDDHLSNFIGCLRNIYGHVGILPVGLSYSVKNNELKPNAILDFSNFDKYKNEFNEKAKKYINDYGVKYIDILVICKDYIEKSIYPWFLQRQNEIHGKEFLEYKKIQKEAKDLYEKLQQ